MPAVGDKQIKHQCAERSVVYRAGERVRQSNRAEPVPHGWKPPPHQSTSGKQSEKGQEARHLHLPVWTRSWHLTFDCFRASIKVPLSDGPCCKITSELKVDPWWGLELSSETAPTGTYIPDRNVVDLSGGGRNGCVEAPTDTAPSAGRQGANICPFEPTGWSELDRRIDTNLSRPDSRWDGG